MACCRQTLVTAALPTNWGSLPGRGKISTSTDALATTIPVNGGPTRLAKLEPVTPTTRESCYVIQRLPIVEATPTGEATSIEPVTPERLGSYRSSTDLNIFDLNKI
ncbi:UNVERIFIED_CONTAM: hypothetical protein GTU68_006423 [Idotea baltica]|nr:hypothetical protein [Idotea baltica]